MINRTGKPREECGVFGIVNSEQSARKAYLGLYALQHRGQESAGISTVCEGKIMTYKRLGLVSDIFNNEEIFERLPGDMAIAHNRYSTSGSTTLNNAQPLTVSFKAGMISAAHNGNLVNAGLLRKQMENDGTIFTTTSDSEVLLHLIARSKEDDLQDMIISALQQLQGAYSFLLLTPDALYAVRDPHGIRPLCIGKKGDEWAVSSETCAFDLLQFDYIRTVEPGELVILRKGQKPESIRPFPEVDRFAGCVFEFIYFARPDSFVFNKPVDKVRRRMGRQLAKEAPVADADAVIAVPDSSNTAALGYANELGIPFELGLIRNHYIGRTFILPKQMERDISARIKYNPVKGILKGKKIVVVDDSIVRGTTSKKLVSMIRDAGAREIHFRVASPEIIAPCYYGVDTPQKDKLIAALKSNDEIAEHLQVESLKYLSIEGLKEISHLDHIGLCYACFNEKYPVPIKGYDNLNQKKCFENKFSFEED
ncbi:MAG: amidophosphoribosyltransferase [Candidatus Zixiibacteriota bacterium]